MSPLVSVLTPTYNRRRFIPQYLKNLRRQTYRHFEVLICDDGSDPIADLLPSEIRYLRVERMPLGAKRNLLAREARGDILVHMDDDDYYPPSRIGHAVERLTSSDNQIGGAGINYIYYAPTGQILVSGPFAKNHALDGTFVFYKEYLQQHSFDDLAIIRLEAAFTNNFTVPMTQLDPESTILIIQHGLNTWDKTKTAGKESGKRLKNFVSHREDRRFYLSLKEDRDRR